MPGKEKKAAPGRRDFLKLMGLSGVAAAAAAPTAPAKASPPPAKSAGYRETEHVKTFYKLARF